MSTLITGVTGFVGGHLAEYLLDRGNKVVGLSRTAKWPDELAHLAGSIPLAAVDIADADKLRDTIQQLQPKRVYHLAAHANAPESIRDPEGTWRSNVTGSRNLFNSVAAVVPEARVLHVGSGTVYGQPPPEDLPITERTPLRPQTPYAESKAAADQLACEYAREGRLSIVVARPFNLLGPRQSTAYVMAHFAAQVAQLETREQSRNMHVGRLDVSRDFTDVRDAVRAYELLLDRAPAGEIYNIATGTTHVLGDLLKYLLDKAQRSIEVVQDPKLLRGKDPSVVEVSPDALRQATGWRPQFPIEASLDDLLEYWRRRQAAG